MGLQSQLYTQAEDVMVLQVKPKEFCYWTEPGVFSPHTNQFPLNQGTEVIVLKSIRIENFRNFRKSKITEWCQISYSAPGFCVGYKNPRKQTSGAASVASLLPWDWQNQLLLFSLAQQEHEGLLMETCTKLWRKAPFQPKPVAGTHMGRIRWAGHRR